MSRIKPPLAGTEDNEMSSLSKIEDNIPALRRYAWSLTRNQTEADDLVQDALVQALDRADSKSGEGDVRSWLFSIMHNQFVSRWRRLRSRAAVVVQDEEADVAVGASQQANSELQDALYLLDQLPQEQKQVLLLVAVEGLEYAEVAKILKLPIGTVMSRLSRARDKLRDAMDGKMKSQPQENVAQKTFLRRVK